MSQTRVVWNDSRDEVLLPKGRWCAGTWCRFKGLMLRRTLPSDEGLIFVYRRPSRLDTAIHMFFVFFPISAIWLGSDLRVVDAKLARPWRPAYMPQAPAQYIIEGVPDLLERVAVGDRLRFEPPPDRRA